MTNARPVTQIRLGPVRASIWANETASGTRYNVTLGRLYQKDGEWKTSTSFGQDELLVLCKALDVAYMWIAEKRGIQNNTGRSESGSDSESTSESQGVEDAQVVDSLDEEDLPTSAKEPATSGKARMR